MQHLLLIELWGTGRGPMRHTAPQTRLLAGVVLFWAALFSAPETRSGLLYVAVLVAVWVFLTGVPRRVLWRLLLFGLIIFSPVFLLTPWVDGSDIETSACLFSNRQLCVPWRISIKGIAGMMLATATAASLSLCAFYEALRRLPLPRLVVNLLIQISHQARLLVTETVRVQHALAVRGATSGWRARLQVVRSLPAVWLPRVLFRAERVASAMELRDYGNVLPSFVHSSFRRRDAVVVVAAVFWFIIGIGLRFGLPA